MRPEPMGWKHWGAFLVVSLIAGTAFMFIKLGLRELHPFNLLFWRLLLGVSVLGALAAVLRVRWPRRLEGWVAIISVGLGNVALPQLLIFWSQQTVDTTITAVLVATTPFHTLFTARLLLRDETITPRKLLAMLLAFSGVVMLLWQALGTVTGAGWAVLLPLVSAFCFATSSVAARRFGGGVHPLMMALGATITALLVVGPLVFLTPGAFTVPQQPLSWLAISVLGVLGGGVSYVLFFFLIGSVGPTRAQMNAFVFPLVTMATGVVVLGEKLEPQLLLGGAMILGGIWVFIRPPAARAAQPAPVAAMPQPVPQTGAPSGE